MRQGKKVEHVNYQWAENHGGLMTSPSGTGEFSLTNGAYDCDFSVLNLSKKSSMPRPWLAFTSSSNFDESIPNQVPLLKSNLTGWEGTYGWRDERHVFIKYIMPWCSGLYLIRKYRRAGKIVESVVDLPLPRRYADYTMNFFTDNSKAVRPATSAMKDYVLVFKVEIFDQQFNLRPDWDPHGINTFQLVAEFKTSSLSEFIEFPTVSESAWTGGVHRLYSKTLELKLGTQ